MLVAIRMNRYGHLEIDPVNERTARKIRRHLRSIGVSCPEHDSLVYVQDDGAIYDARGDFGVLSRRDLDEGRTVRVRVDPYLFCCYVGYDTHEIL